MSFIDVFYTPMYADGNTEVLLAFINTEEENSAYGTANVYMTTTYKNYYANDGDCKRQTSIIRTISITVVKVHLHKSFGKLMVVREPDV